MDHADVNHDGAIDIAEFADWATGKTLFRSLDIKKRKEKKKE